MIGHTKDDRLRTHRHRDTESRRRTEDPLSFVFTYRATRPLYTTRDVFFPRQLTFFFINTSRELSRNRPTPRSRAELSHNLDQIRFLFFLFVSFFFSPCYRFFLLSFLLLFLPQHRERSLEDLNFSSFHGGSSLGDHSPCTRARG